MVNPSLFYKFSSSKELVRMVVYTQCRGSLHKLPN